MVSNENTAELVIAIAKTLGVEMNKNNFSSYPVANKKFVIVHFYNLRSKQQILGKIRIKKSLMAEEVFNGASNSQIYLNDHLTPYFNKIYLMARNGKKDGKLASASSYGGKIRARKSPNDAPILITSEIQLQALIDTENTINSLQSQQHADEMMNVSHSTSHNSQEQSTSNSTSKPNRTRRTNTITKRADKRVNSIEDKNTTTITTKATKRRNKDKEEENQSTSKKQAIEKPSNTNNTIEIE